MLVNLSILLVPGAGIEPAQPQGPRDFKSLASTNSATQALYKVFFNHLMNLCQAVILSINSYAMPRDHNLYSILDI